MTRSTNNTHRIGAVAAAFAFISFFVWIVIIADTGNGTPWWSVIIDHLPYGDKVGHLCLVSMLSFLCNLAFPSRRWSIITLTTLVLLTVLTLEESSQGLIRSRTLDFFDWLADVAGLAIGQFCALRASNFLKRRSSTLRSLRKDLVQ